MNTELIRLFVKVVQNAGFSKAALSLKMPKSTLSKAINRLECDIGTKLMLRTTRNLTLTAAGRKLYESSFGALQILEEAQKSIFGQDNIFVGHIKITLPSDVSKIVAKVVSDISKKYPDLFFTLNCTNQVMDLIKDGFDIAIRIGKLHESSFKAKRIGDFVLIPVAAPHYIQNHAEIRHPMDLITHHCLAYDNHALSTTWLFKSKTESIKVPMKPKICCDQMPSLLEMTIAGAGIAIIPQHLCKQDITTGRLIRILPTWEGVRFPISIITPMALSSSLRLRATVDLLFDAIQKEIKWSIDNYTTDSFVKFAE